MPTESFSCFLPEWHPNAGCGAIVQTSSEKTASSYQMPLRFRSVRSDWMSWRRVLLTFMRVYDLSWTISLQLAASRSCIKGHPLINIGQLPLLGATQKMPLWYFHLRPVVGSQSPMRSVSCSMVLQGKRLNTEMHLESCSLKFDILLILLQMAQLAGMPKWRWFVLVCLVFDNTNIQSVHCLRAHNILTQQMTWEQCHPVSQLPKHFQVVWD